jgi:hypothetical protein
MAALSMVLARDDGLVAVTLPRAEWPGVAN